MLFFPSKADLSAPTTTLQGNECNILEKKISPRIFYIETYK